MLTLNIGMKSFRKFVEAITTDIEYVKKNAGSYQYRGAEFVWVAYQGDKIVKTGKMGSASLEDAKKDAKQILAAVDGVDRVEILGKDDKVLATVEDTMMEISGTEPAMDLGVLTKPGGSGKAKKAKVKRPDSPRKDMEEMIRHEGGEWVLYSKDGKKVLGRAKTKEDIIKRERQVQFFKRQG